MSTDTTYNGWTNYATWVVNLWMDNDQGSQQYWVERAQECYNDAEADKYSTREENATRALADEIKEQHESGADELGAQGVFSDLITSALGDVNWQEIAEHLIGEVDKAETEEE